MRVDFRYSDVAYELWAVGRLVGLSERMIALAGDEEEDRIWADLKARGWHDDPAEQQFASQDVEDIREVALPRYTRGAIVVAVWAGYESTVLDVAERLANALGRTQAFEQRDRRDFLRTIPDFFRGELGIALDEDPARLVRLRDVLDARTAFAHAGGRIGRLNRDLQTRLRRMRGLAINDLHDVVIPAEGFLAAAYADVSASLASLVERAKAREDGIASRPNR